MSALWLPSSLMHMTTARSWVEICLYILDMGTPYSKKGVALGF